MKSFTDFRSQYTWPELRYNMQNEACLTEDSEELKDQSIQMPKILSILSQIHG